MCNHFNIEDGRKYTTFLAYYALFQERLKTQLKHKKKTCAMYGEGAVTDQMCQKWFARFCAGGFSVHDVPHSGRPAEVGSDQIKTIN